MPETSNIIKAPPQSLPKIVCNPYCLNFIMRTCPYASNRNECLYWHNCGVFWNSQICGVYCEINWNAQQNAGNVIQCWQYCPHWKSDYYPQKTVYVDKKPAANISTPLSGAEQIEPPTKKHELSKAATKPTDNKVTVAPPRSLPKENIPDNIKNLLRQKLNSIIREKDILKWISELNKITGIDVSLIEYNVGRRLWKRSSLRDTPELACASYDKHTGIIVFPSPNIGNIHVTRVGDWYDLNGKGNNYTINSLAFAVIENSTEFSVDLARRGVIILS